MSDDETDDTLTFNMKNTFIFRPDLSKGLTGNEIITTIHPMVAVLFYMHFYYKLIAVIKLISYFL